LEYTRVEVYHYSSGGCKEKERLRKLIEQQKERMEQDPVKENPGLGLDYAQLYREQTGKDLTSGDYVLQ